ncbi:MAG TPA: electron transfer flavoprotein subunit alpha/FixB family protein [Tepidiformaceae bacterium]
MSLRVLVAASPRSSAAHLAQRFIQESGGDADIVLMGGSALPTGRWGRAWTAAADWGRAAVEAVSRMVADSTYDAVLVDDTEDGRELAGRLAARCLLPAVGQAVGLRVVRGELQVVRNAEAGTRTALMVPCGRPVILVVSPSIGEAAGAPGTAEETIRLDTVAQESLFRLTSEVQLGPGQIELEEAEVVVAGGRGVGSREGFEMLEELAGLLGGTVGASRVAVDAGWSPYRRQVGLTGKTVTPRLYIACGISGAPHHVLGMRNSSLIVAINSDPQAPIFQIAHVAVVGRVEEVVPQLISEVRGRRASRQPELQAVGT